LVHDAGPLENNDIRGAQTQVSQERRLSARRGSVNRTLPRENRTLCSGYRTPIQERRASVRRGSGIAPAMASVSCRTWMLACHGGLTPPALLLPCECLPTKKRFLRWTNACLQERRLSARRGSVNRTLPRENRTLCSGYRTPIQERRALARRGSVTLCNGVDSPRLAYASRSWCTNGRLMQHTLVAIWTRTFAGAAGVSPPWFGNETGLQCTPNHVSPLTTNRTKSGDRRPAVVR
jgi:hypothetical protein